MTKEIPASPTYICAIRIFMNYKHTADGCTVMVPYLGMISNVNPQDMTRKSCSIELIIAIRFMDYFEAVNFGSGNHFQPPYMK